MISFAEIDRLVATIAALGLAGISTSACALEVQGAGQYTN